MGENETAAVTRQAQRAAAALRRQDAAAATAGTYDAYALPPDAIAEPPVGAWEALRKIGPGLILAGAIVGTGELIATTNLGAKVGFGLLWLVIVSCIIKVFVQAELGRHAISSGETTLASFHRLPGPGFLIGWWWVVMALMTQLQLGAMVGGVGQAIHMALPGASPRLAHAVGLVSASAGSYLHARPEVPWAIVTAVGTSIWLAAGSYRVIERVTTVMVVAFTFVTVLCVVMLPAAGHPIAWNDVAGGLKFQVPAGAVMAAIAMFGITGVGASELIAYPYWCIEKGYARRAGANDGSAAWVRRARGWLRVMKLDVWVSMGIYTLATLGFYFLGASVLHRAGSGQGLPNTVGAMLTELSRMYLPVMGPRGAVWFIVIGVIAVLYSTLFSATAANSRAIADFLHVNRLARFDVPADRTRWVRRLCIIFPLVDLGLFLWVGKPVLMVIIGAFAQAMTLPMIAGAAVYLRYKSTDRRLTPGMAWDVFLWLSLAGMLVAAAYGAYDAVK